MPNLQTEVILRLLSRFDQFTDWRFVADETKALFAEVLMECAKSNEHADAIVKSWCAKHTAMPVEADLRQLAASTPVPAKVVPVDRNCPFCHGEGRESCWGLVTTERWLDSGRIKSRTLERIPPRPGRERFYLIERPEIEAQVDGRSQVVSTFSGYCQCAFGRHLATVQPEAIRREAGK